MHIYILTSPEFLCSPSWWEAYSETLTPNERGQFVRDISF